MTTKYEFVIPIKPESLIAKQALGAHHERMQGRLSFISGSAALAAVALVALLASAAIAYERQANASRLSVAQQSLLAAAASSGGGSSVKVDEKGCAIDSKTGLKTCPCMQKAQSQSTVDELCEPGCIYDVHPGAAGGDPLVTLDPDSKQQSNPYNPSDASKKECKVMTCPPQGSSGSCIAVSDTHVESKLDAATVAQIQAAGDVANNPSPEKVDNYSQSGNDLSYLSSALDPSQNTQLSQSVDKSQLTAANSELQSIADVEQQDEADTGTDKTPVGTTPSSSFGLNGPNLNDATKNQVAGLPLPDSGVGGGAPGAQGGAGSDKSCTGSACFAADTNSTGGSGSTIPGPQTPTGTTPPGNAVSNKGSGSASGGSNGGGGGILSGLGSLFGGGNSGGLMNGLAAFTAGFLKGATAPAGGAAAAGNQTPYSAGTCNVQYVCGNGMLYYQQSTCVQQAVQSCQYGCASASTGNANACALSPQTTSPYGTGTNGVACTQPPTEPSASTCAQGSWQSVSATSNGCTTGWQCVPTGTQANAAAPTATLTCNSQLADVGDSVSVSYSCGGGSTSSVGGGFDTGGSLSGTTSVTMARPPASTTLATYTLQCSNGSANAGAQCSVSDNVPSIVLVANPSTVQTGQSSTIGWVTAGMRACTVSSPDSDAFTSANAGNRSINGVATLQGVSGTTTVVLSCVSLAGNQKTAQTVVQAGNLAGISVNASVAGSSASHGAMASISWSAPSAPGSGMSLWIVDVAKGSATALIASDLPLSGSYAWNVPPQGGACVAGAANVCASDLVAGKQYRIEAIEYAPANAYVGNGQAPANPAQPTYGASAVTPTFTMSD